MNHAFNDDTFLQQTFADLITKHQPGLIIETGTHHGYTTEYLGSFELPVISTEIFEEFFSIAKARLKHLANVSVWLGDSTTLMTRSWNVIDSHKVVYFLDAHFGDDQALDRELDLLARHTIKPVIMIHDFFVPDKPFGYDSWDGHRYDYEFYKPAFDKIYGVDGYTHRYNEEATGACRGVIIIEPKE